MLFSSGHVVTMECFEKLIKKDWLHPLTGEKLMEKDIIPLQRVLNTLIKLLIFVFFLFYCYILFY